MATREVGGYDTVGVFPCGGAAASDGPGDVWPAAQREVAEQADWYGKPIALKGGPDGNTDCGCSRR